MVVWVKWFGPPVSIYIHELVAGSNSTSKQNLHTYGWARQRVPEATLKCHNSPLIIHDKCIEINRTPGALDQY